MAQRWGRRGPTDEQAGPYQFHLTYRRCPSCGEILLTQENVSFGAVSKIMHLLGAACYCIACNGRYRVIARPWMRFMPWLVGGAAAIIFFGALASLCVPCPNKAIRLATLAALVLSGLALSRLFPICRWLWWRLGKMKKIFTYQDGF